MKNLKKVIVPVGLDESAAKLLRPLRDMEFLQQTELHFVHVFNTISYSFGLGMVPLVYPVEADRKQIEASTNAALESLARSIMPETFKGKIIHRVLFSEDAKKSFSNYVMEQKPDLLIIPTRSKHGIFESSFAAYVNRHTNTDILMLKQNE